MQKNIIFGAIMVLSGVASWYLFENLPLLDDPIVSIPTIFSIQGVLIGVLWGIATALMLWPENWHGRLVRWTLYSFLAWLVSYHLTLILFILVHLPYSVYSSIPVALPVIIGAIGGIVGAIIITFAAKPYYPQINSNDKVRIYCSGMLSGAIMFSYTVFKIDLVGDNPWETIFHLMGFVLWQTSVGLSLKFINRNQG